MTPHPEHIPLTEQVLTERLGLNDTYGWYGIEKLPEQWVIIKRSYGVFITTLHKYPPRSQPLHTVADLQLAVYHMFGIELTFKQ